MEMALLVLIFIYTVLSQALRLFLLLTLPLLRDLQCLNSMLYGHKFLIITFSLTLI